MRPTRIVEHRRDGGARESPTFFTAFPKLNAFQGSAVSWKKSVTLYVPKKRCAFQRGKKSTTSAHNNGVRAWKRRAIIIHRALMNRTKQRPSRLSLFGPKIMAHCITVTSRTSKGHPRDRERRRRSPSSSHFFPVGRRRPSRGACLNRISYFSFASMYILYTRRAPPTA